MMRQNWRGRSIGFSVLLGANAIALLACTKPLDTTRLERDIQQAVTQQGGTTLKTVICPEDVALAAGKGFDCVGTLDTGEAITIPVRQTDDRGSTTWEVPNSRVLLNLPKLATLFQEALQHEGKKLTIDCGTGYRPVQAGDRFECQVSKTTESSVQPQKQPKKQSKPSIDPKQPETIIVTIDPQKNVNWQQVLPAPAVVASSQKTTPQPSTENSAASQSSPAPIVAEDRAKLSPTVLKKLEQMGGGDME